MTDSLIREEMALKKDRTCLEINSEEQGIEGEHEVEVVVAEEEVKLKLN